MMRRMTGNRDAEGRSRRWTLAALAGAGVSAGLWSFVALTGAFSESSSRHFLQGALVAAMAAAAGGGVAFADRASGQAFVVAAFLTTLVVFTYRIIGADDVLWPVSLLLLGLGALAAFVTAFALARVLRTGSTMR